MRRLRNAASGVKAPRRAVRDQLPRSAAGLGLALLLFSSFSPGQILTGPFSPASPPFISPLGGGILYLSLTQIKVDQNSDGVPDVVYDLPPEIQPLGPYFTDARLSPTEQILYTVKTPTAAPVPGCGPSEARVFFHALGTPPSGITALNPGGTCVPGPIAIGPLFNDLSATSTIRTAIVVGAVAPVPSKTPVLWVDLVNGGSNLDSFNYDSDVEQTAVGIQFAPSGNAAYIQHGSNTARHKYTLIDLCVSPIAGAGSLATGDLTPGTPSAWVIPGAGPGTFIAEVRVNGQPIVTSRLNLSNCQTSSGPPPTLTVNDAGDTLHNTPPTGCAITGIGTCTLRDAITYANAHLSSTIHFNIAGPGVHTITPATALPTMTAPMTIDGYSQPGASPNTNPPGAGDNAAIRIEIDGGNHGFSGLTVTGGHAVIRGLAVNRMLHAISVFPGGAVIAGNFIGSDATGTVKKANTGNGVIASNSLIGGSAPADRNVISGNNGFGVFGDALLIQGNFIGLNAAGDAALGNGSGISLFPGSVVGGTTPGERNVIAGSSNGSVFVGGSCTISGNYIGVDATGSSTFSAFDGVGMGGDGNTLGGTAGTSPGGACTGACNVISSPFGHVGVNGSGNVVAGNFIGLNAAGTAFLGPPAGYCVSLFNANGAIIGGTSPSARNVIGNCFREIYIANSPGTIVAGNFLGTDTTGSVVPQLPIVLNTNGVFLEDSDSSDQRSDNTVIGGTAGVTPNGACTGACNVIAGHDFGISLAPLGASGPGLQGLLVQGNHIGVGASATTILPNITGIQVGGNLLAASPFSVTIGGLTPAEGNLISGNAAAGILVSVGPGTQIIGNTISGNGLVAGPTNHDGIVIDGGTGTTVTQNSIFGNGGLGIDLPPVGQPAVNDPCDADTGENDLQNYPVLTSANSSSGTTTIAGTLNSTASTPFTVDFYANPACSGTGYGEGRTYLGSATVTTDGSCNASFNVSLPVSVAPGSFITATATNPGGSTSEFSHCAALNGGSPVPTQIFTLAPCRLVDTRNPNGPLGGPAITVGPDRAFILSGHCGIPITAKAVSINVTITQPTALGDLRIYPGGSPLPLVSAINYRPGQTRANNALAPLGPAGDLLVHCDQASGTVHLIIDVNGYFQ